MAHEPCLEAPSAGCVPDRGDGDQCPGEHRSDGRGDDGEVQRVGGQRTRESGGEHHDAVGGEPDPDGCRDQRDEPAEQRQAEPGRPDEEHGDGGESGRDRGGTEQVPGEGDDVEAAEGDAEPHGERGATGCGDSDAVAASPEEQDHREQDAGKAEPQRSDRRRGRAERAGGEAGHLAVAEGVETWGEEPGESEPRDGRRGDEGCRRDRAWRTDGVARDRRPPSIVGPSLVMSTA